MKIDCKQRIIGFDLARVISIIYIVLYHSLGYGSPFYSNSIIRTLAYLSLSIFTFQSGFLLAIRYDLSNCKFVEFMKKRLLRIYPLFIISSVLLCFMGFNSWFNTAKSWFGISPFWIPTPRTMWYIGLLIYLYACTLFWAKGGIKIQLFKFIITLGILVGIQFVFHSVDSRTFYYSIIYFGGILVGQNWSKEFFNFVTSRRFVILFLCIFVSILIVQLFTMSLLITYGNSIFGMIALFSVYIFLGEKWKSNKHLVSLITALSYATFCLYLFHREVFQLLIYLWVPNNQLNLVLYIGLLGLVISLPMAYYIQKAYDKIIQ